MVWDHEVAGSSPVIPISNLLTVFKGAVDMSRQQELEQYMTTVCTRNCSNCAMYTECKMEYKKYFNKYMNELRHQQMMNARNLRHVL